MSIEAMKLALEALEGINDEDRDKDFLTLKQFVRLDMATEALRTAIQQAEAQQVENSTATGEPVWFHKHWCDGDDIFYRPDDKIPSGSTPLYAHPAPSDDVVRDAISTVREHYRGTDWGKAAESICDAIDAAMLSSHAQKGD